MRYLALAVDYDGTLADHGHVSAETVRALKRFRESSRRLILVTGREVEELSRLVPSLRFFDSVVAENGALLYAPETGAIRPLSSPPPIEFVERLRQRGVAPLSTGRGIVATKRPWLPVVEEVIRETKHDLQIILNRNALMILPRGIDKRSGLSAALDDLQLFPNQVIGAGDAENDAAFLSLCGYSVAVSNALPALKTKVDFVTGSPQGAGIVELIDAVLEDSLPERLGDLGRRLD
jgi:hydroxymethylpyrimidine pyrophosphatase-like HAD family hydrolase